LSLPSLVPLRRGLAGGLLALGLWGGTVGAQVLPLPQPRPTPPTPADTLRPQVRPLPAFFRSLVIPGWGQAVLDRKLTTGLFLLWEGVTLGMTLKTSSEVRYLQDTEATRVEPGATTESPLLRSKKAEHQDWLVLLAFNHLFSGLEAYVSAHLWDFPADLQLRAMPMGPPGRRGVAVAIPVRLR